jgi:transcriptional regulator with XRE-family HTH domain
MNNKIKEIRKQRGLTQPELAKKVGTSRSQITKLERGERQLTQHWMERIAAALECNPQDLLPGTPTLTEKEKAVLAVYNKLTPEQQRAVMQVATALSEPAEEIDHEVYHPKSGTI